MGGVITPSLLLSVNLFLEDVHAFGQDYHALEKSVVPLGALGSMGGHLGGLVRLRIRIGACPARATRPRDPAQAPILMPKANQPTQMDHPCCLTLPMAPQTFSKHGNPDRKHEHPQKQVNTEKQARVMTPPILIGIIR